LPKNINYFKIKWIDIKEINNQLNHKLLVFLKLDKILLKGFILIKKIKKLKNKNKKVKIKLKSLRKNKKE